MNDLMLQVVQTPREANEASPSELVFAKLRAAYRIVCLDWPEGTESLAIIRAETDAARMASEHRSLNEFAKAKQCNDIALACYWVLSSLLNAHCGDTVTEKRHAARAQEHLGWVKDHG